MRGKCGVIHAAMTWSRAGRGQVFATGNYTFLRMGRGITYKLLDNVWAKARGLALAVVLLRSPGCGGSASGEASDAAARAAARADGARPGEGERPAVAERLARALRGPDALLGDAASSRTWPSRGTSARAASSGRSTCARGSSWSDDTPITPADFKRSWLRALAPSTNAPYAGPELGIVRGARHLHATGNGSIGVQALDDRTLRVTLQHPVPWFDELAAFPVAAPVPPRPTLVQRSVQDRLPRRRQAHARAELQLLERGRGEAEPRRPRHRLKGADAVLPRQLAGPGLPWIDTAGPAAPSADELELLATGQLWLVTRGTPLSDLLSRRYVAWVITHLDLGTKPVSFVPPAMPGASVVNSHESVVLQSAPQPLRLTLSWAEQDLGASKIAAILRRHAARLRQFELFLSFRPVPTVAELEAQDADLILLGWSSKVFDPYNQLDQFTCGSAFNVARWCNPSYDAGMREAVRDARRRGALADRAQASREAARRRAGRPPLLRRRQLLARAGRARLLVVADRPLRAAGHDALVDLEHAPRDGGVRVHPLDVLAAAAAERRQLRPRLDEAGEHVLEVAFVRADQRQLEPEGLLGLGGCLGVEVDDDRLRERHRLDREHPVPADPQLVDDHVGGRVAQACFARSGRLRSGRARPARPSRAATRRRRGRPRCP